MNFDNHRWIQLHNLAVVVEQNFESLRRAIAAMPPHIRDWINLIDSNAAICPAKIKSTNRSL